MAMENKESSDIFHNGRRALIASALIFAASVVLLVVTSIIYLFGQAQEHGLGDYPSPRAVLNRLPGYESHPAVLEFGHLTVRGQACVDGKDVIATEVYINYRRRDEEEGTRSVPDLNGELQSRVPGCNTNERTAPLPEGVTPGLWRVEGVERDTNYGSLRTWFSEEFIVVGQNR